jgi:hypothetical protein
MKEERILTGHPLCKSGKNIKIADCELFTKAIIKTLKGKELTHTEMMSDLNNSLAGKFPGNIGWYAETVKLHLEATDVIERTTSKPAKYRLKNKQLASV